MHQLPLLTEEEYSFLRFVFVNESCVFDYLESNLPDHQEESDVDHWSNVRMSIIEKLGGEIGVNLNIAIK